MVSSRYNKSRTDSDSKPPLVSKQLQHLPKGQMRGQLQGHMRVHISSFVNSSRRAVLSVIGMYQSELGRPSLPTCWHADNDYSTRGADSFLGILVIFDCAHHERGGFMNDQLSSK